MANLEVLPAPVAWAGGTVARLIDRSAGASLLNVSLGLAIPTRSSGLALSTDHAETAQRRKTALSL